VSNSSSSSYLIKVPKQKECPTCGLSNNILLNLIEELSDDKLCDETYIHARGTKEILKCFLNDYCITDTDDLENVNFEYEDEEKNFNNIKEICNKADKDGEELIFINVSYNDQTFNRILEPLKVSYEM
jgi:hypothetical protein